MNSNELLYLKNQIRAFSPITHQERCDRIHMLSYLDSCNDLLTRDNPAMHFTASAWITDPSYSKILMIYHNIYNSWSWVGGHADGESCLFRTALREAKEETGLQSLQGKDSIFSLEILCVNGHIKKGAYVSSHLHLNLTYVFTAEEHQPLHIKPDENCNIGWIPADQVLCRSSEPWMYPVYRKLLDRMPSP